MDAALGITVRWALVADLMLLFGVPLFSSYSIALIKALLPLRPMVITAALAGLLLSALGITILAATMSGVPLAATDPATVAMLVTGTTIGMAFKVRAVALLLALALGLFGRADTASRITITVCGGVALATLAWSGHGVMNDGRTGIVHLVADVIHLLAAGIWVGALAALAWLLLQQKAAIGILHAALAGFASIGSATVAIILASGTINSWLLVGPAKMLALENSLYGRLLLLKLALFTMMLSLAARNRFRLTPALAKAATPLNARQTTRALQYSIGTELVCAIAILGLVAWLGTLEPPVSMP